MNCYLKIVDKAFFQTYSVNIQQRMLITLA